MVAAAELGDRVGIALGVEQRHEASRFDARAAERLFVVTPVGAVLETFLESFNEHPMRQKPSGFNPRDSMDAVWRMISQPAGGN